MQSLNLNSLIKKTNYHRPLIFNGVLWVLAFTILLFVFSKGKAPIKVDYIYTSVFIILLAIPVSINFYIYIPKLLKQEKYGLYIVSFVINLLIFALLGAMFLNHILDTLFPSYFFISYLSKPNIILVFIIFLIATTLLKLAEDWFYFNTNENKILRLKNQQIETQLSTLRAQINPHFLFNSLNVIYALALEKKEGVTNAIVQLSDILRYVIYDSDTERVSIKDEISLLKNYIAFHNHRVEIPNTTHFEINIVEEHFKIYPMLLLPLLENSYKHGVVAGQTKTPIKIMLYQNGNQFKFNISNANLNTKNQLEEKYSGVGIENLKNNLNLVYPNQHQFEVNETKDTFEVTLIINEA
ncbi:sensor histidine kinase [Winogradskyella sp. PG-2]|uniref:sensor histidine kinase n=1 Tax=Winogradskyella sp. PG-2 TaxID=754409 RepID=UPI0004586660|nr:histidine kinase [Winogradskyella sp. PG-2]BAO77051.1 putative two-component system sensor protein, no kinase domain [Winogradskyella sp. PG-2]